MTDDDRDELRGRAADFCDAPGRMHRHRDADRLRDLLDARGAAERERDDAIVAVGCLVRAGEGTELDRAAALDVGGRWLELYRPGPGSPLAAGFAACIPIMIFAFVVQNHLVRGLSFGAVKG